WEIEPPTPPNTEGTTRVCLPWKQHRDQHAFHRSRNTGGGGPLGSVGGGASRVHCAFEGLLQVCPRPDPGSSLFIDSGKTARRSSSSNREAPHRAHSPGEAGGGDIRD